jgi:hypothetical protein
MASDKRALALMHLAVAHAGPRCGAKTRAGRPCRSPIVRGRKRCRMHGGAAGSGGAKGERNGRYTVGRFTHEAKARRREAREFLAKLRELISAAG